MVINRYLKTLDIIEKIVICEKLTGCNISSIVKEYDKFISMRFYIDSNQICAINIYKDKIYFKFHSKDCSAECLSLTSMLKLLKMTLSTDGQIYCSS